MFEKILKTLLKFTHYKTDKKIFLGGENIDDTKSRKNN